MDPEEQQIEETTETEATEAVSTEGLDNPESALELIKKLRAEVKNLKKATVKAEVPEDVAAELEELREERQARQEQADNDETKSLEKKGEFDKLLAKERQKFAAQTQSLEAKLAQANGDLETSNRKIEEVLQQVEQSRIEAEISRAYFANGGQKNSLVEKMLKQSLIGSARLNDDGSIHVIDGDSVVLNHRNEPITLAEYMATNEEFKQLFPVPPSSGTGRPPSGVRAPADKPTSGKLQIPRSHLSDLAKMRTWKNENGFSGSVTDNIGTKIEVIEG